MTDQKCIVLSIGSKGGTGKSTVLMLVADYLRSKDAKLSIIDCDLGNRGHISSFSNWFGGKSEVFDVRRQQDLDGILESCAASAMDYALVDLPANSLCNVQSWLEEICTAQTLREVGMRMVCLASIAPVLGSVEGVLDFMSVLGPQASYIVALNRLEKDFAPPRLEETFADWMSVDLKGFQDIHSIEVTHLDAFARDALIKSGSLPYRIDKSDLKYWVRLRISKWATRVHAQLEKTGLFLDRSMSISDSAG